MLGGIHGDASQALLGEIARLFKQYSLLASALQQGCPPWRKIWDELKLPLEEAAMVDVLKFSRGSTWCQLRLITDVFVQAPGRPFPILLQSHGLTSHKRTSIEVLLKVGSIGM